MSSELTRTNNAALTAMPLSEVMTLGEVFVKSGYFADIRQQAQAVVKIMTGAELGLPPIASMQGIHVIQGKPTLSANLMAGAVKRSGRYDYRVLTLTDERCEIAFMERVNGKLEEIGRTAFTKEDARRAEVKNLTKYPRNMLFARAMSNGVRFFCPDVFYGPVYTPEEFGTTLGDDGRPETAERVDTTTGEVIESGFASSAPVAPDEDAQEASNGHTSGKKRGDSTADGVERNQRAAGIIAHKEWMTLHELDDRDRELSCYLLGIALGHDIESRKDLSGQEWGKANYELAQLQPEQVVNLRENFRQLRLVNSHAPDDFAEALVSE